VFLNPNQPYFTVYTSSLAGHVRVPQGFSFTYGEPSNVYVCLGVATGLGIIPAGRMDSHVTNNSCSPGQTAGSAQPGNASGTANFLNWTLSGITVTDSAGNPVNDATFTSASGTRYGPSEVAPEPRSIVLLSIGLIILLRCCTGGFTFSPSPWRRRLR
jgi:hypothetical protein